MAFLRSAVLCLLVLAAPAPAQPFDGDPPVNFTVSVTSPHTRTFTVTCGFKVPDTGAVVLDFAAWTPGYVILWNYGQHVTRFEAYDQMGQPVKVDRVSVSRWVIQRPATPTARIRYEVRANDTDVDLGFAQAYLDSTGGWYNGAALFPEIHGYRRACHSVSFHLPPGWRTATAMAPRKDQTGYVVRDYDELVDSPVQVGRFLRRNFSACGVDCGVVVAGCDSVNMDSLAALIRTIVAAQFDFMRGAPIERYLFILHAASRGAGGLEHANATTISVRTDEFFKRNSWLKIVIAHEFFHLWNAKRIHPRTFDLYNYAGPHRTRTVWFSEGITAYYTDILLHRAGCMTREEVYASLANIIDLYENNPAHTRLSWEDISWHIWDPEILQGLNTWLLPGWMLDLLIRDSTDNRFTLDDVMRFMDTWYGDPGSGFDEDDIQRICGAIAQRDFAGFFRDHISAPKSFPYKALLAAAGLEWRVTTYETADIGCELWFSGGGRNRITWLDESGKAFQAGLRRGDFLREINGVPCGTRAEYANIQKTLTVGTTAQLTVLRGGERVVANVPVTARAMIRSAIAESESPTPRQLNIRNGILQGFPH